MKGTLPQEPLDMLCLVNFQERFFFHLELPAQVDPQRFDKYVQEAAQQEGQAEQ